MSATFEPRRHQKFVSPPASLYGGVVVRIRDAGEYRFVERVRNDEGGWDVFERGPATLTFKRLGDEAYRGRKRIFFKEECRISDDGSWQWVWVPDDRIPAEPMTPEKKRVGCNMYDD